MILTGRETFQKFKFFKRNLGTEFSLHIFFSICLCAQVIFLVEVGRRTIFIICFILVTQVIIYFQRFSSGLIDFHCFLYDVADDYYSLSGPQVIFIWLCVCVCGVLSMIRILSYFGCMCVVLFLLCFHGCLVEESDDWLYGSFIVCLFQSAKV